MLGRDDFYWFRIYSAPFKNIYKMSINEIEKYNLLTGHLVQKNLTKTERMSGNIPVDINQSNIGNKNTENIIVNAQGGPILELEQEILNEIFVETGKIDD